MTASSDSVEPFQLTLTEPPADENVSLNGASTAGAVLVDGELVDGVLVDGVLVDGVLVDGELVDGELVDGVLVDGELVDGELVDGELVDGTVTVSLGAGIVSTTVVGAFDGVTANVVGALVELEATLEVDAATVDVGSTASSAPWSANATPTAPHANPRAVAPAIASLRLIVRAVGVAASMTDLRVRLALATFGQ